MDRAKVSYFLLRAGLAFAFLYAAVAAWLEPSAWIGWFPPYVAHLLPNNMVLIPFGIAEIILGLWILSGKKMFIPCLIGAISLFGIAVTNIPEMDIVFRDISLGLVSLGLAISTY